MWPNCYCINLYYLAREYYYKENYEKALEVFKRYVEISKFPAEKEGAFPSFTVRVKPNTTPATTEKDVAEMIVSNQKQITELFTEPTYEEMTEVLGKWLDPSSDADAQGTKPATKPISGATTATGTDDISSAFDSLFNT